jgi:hypothetical protein
MERVRVFRFAEQPVQAGPQEVRPTPNGDRPRLPEAKPAQPKDRQGSYRAARGLNLSQVRPQGLAKVADIGMGVGLLMGVAKGLVNPAAAASPAATSPRLMGELMVLISKASPELSRATMAAPLLGIPNAGGVLASNPQSQQ